MKIRFYLDTKTVLKTTGEHPLRLYIYISAKDRKYPFTQYSSFAKDWDFKKEMPKKSHPLYIAISDFLLEKDRKILNLLNSRDKKTAPDVESIILGKEISDSVYDFWNVRIKELEVHRENTSKTDINTGGTAKKYSDNLNVFKSYKKTLKFSEIDYNFLHKFRLDKSKKCSDGGINAYIANLRAVYNQAVKRGVYKPETSVSPFNGIKTSSKNTKDKYLSLKEMKIIAANPVDHNYYRYFMLCFYLGGLDFIDIASIKKEHIKDNRIKFIRFKGNTQEVIDNYIFDEAQEIIDYFNDPGSEFLTPIHKYVYKPYRQKYIDGFRKIAEDLKIKTETFSKSPRYSFINIGGKELYLNRDIIKEITGHAQNDTHSIYEGRFPDHIKDKIHKEIIDSIKASKI
ncbi:phage integrase SAM-like domain-containing protein [Chryseobacterium artocarpi]|uniref:phage integrase SAM-like domain-containing protein n=1 Tax=Chryseobacterium artocarpi TaxID=1414727 RepID=UPI003F35B470